MFGYAPVLPAEINAVSMINCWDRSATNAPNFRNGAVALMPNNAVIAEL